MGNLCGKQSNDPFAQPGRTLGSAPAPSSGTSRIPARVATRSGDSISEGRTLGGPADTSDARRAAAQAAEERAKSYQPKGKLGKDLATQKQQTRTDTLTHASKQERQYRDADSGTQARTWD